MLLLFGKPTWGFSGPGILSCRSLPVEFRVHASRMAVKGPFLMIRTQGGLSREGVVGKVGFFRVRTLNRFLRESRTLKNSQGSPPFEFLFRADGNRPREKNRETHYGAYIAMCAQSAIEWTEITWNPVTGCSKISDGCKHCYAERMSLRLQAMGTPKYGRGFSVAVHEAELKKPLGWKKPRLVFVNSMSDLFHESVPSGFIESVFAVMNSADAHTFQVLTKRPERIGELGASLVWTPNIWLGVSIESEKWLDRLDELKCTRARVKFLSLEPLLGPLSGVDLGGVDWVIAGGESGPGARPMEAQWVREIRDNCRRSGIPFFFKQWGGVFKKRTGRTLDGRTWDQMPRQKHLRKTAVPNHVQSVEKSRLMSRHP